MIKVVELGPFGCRNTRGEIKDFSRIPESLKVIEVVGISETAAYVELVLNNGDPSHLITRDIDGQP